MYVSTEASPLYYFYNFQLISHTTSRARPVMDAQSDIFSIDSSFVDGELNMLFTRELVTGDTNDVTLDVPRHWIWGIGPVEPESELVMQHSPTSRGVSSEMIDLLKGCSGT